MSERAQPEQGFSATGGDVREPQRIDNDLGELLRIGDQELPRTLAQGHRVGPVEVVGEDPTVFVGR